MLDDVDVMMILIIMMTVSTVDTKPAACTGLHILLVLIFKPVQLLVNEVY